MATTAHSLSVLTNASVKPPVHPATGLSVSLHDRYGETFAYHLDESQVYDDDEKGNEEHVQNSSGLVSFDPAFIGLGSLDLGKGFDCTDEEFYEKLQKLKTENRKTLALCEKLYKKKLSRNGHQKSTIQSPLENDKFETELGPVYISNGKIENDETPVCKPPIGRPPASPSWKAPRPHLSATAPIPRPSSAPVRHPGSLTRSLEEEVYQKIASERSASQHGVRDECLDTQRYLERRGSEELTVALAQIDDMWDNFSIEQYAPRPERPSSAAITRKEKEKEEKEWRHRITIPKPFNMTVREENKESKLSKIKSEVEKMQMEKEKEEEMECQKKFKASPVPAHVYLPMYDEITEKSEARRRYVQQYSKELLKSQEKPFNFMKRENDKKLHTRPKSAPLCDSDLRNSKTFTAKPVPAFIYDNSVNDKIAEEEEYRKIRIKMHAEDLLKTASLPPNMEAMKHMEEKKRKDRQMKIKKKTYSRSKVSHDVPDYDELYRHFQKELARRKREREATVMKPFNFNTMHIKSKKEKVAKELEEEAASARKLATPRRLGALSMSLDSLPAKNTASADLRNSYTKKKLHDMTKSEREQLEADRKRRIQEMRLRKTINERTSGSDTNRSLEQTYKDKLKTMRRETRAREEEYRKEIEDMKDKVQKRPLLFEQESQTNARTAAQKKFSATLKSHGLDEDFIQSRSSRAASVNIGDSGDDDDDFSNYKTSTFTDKKDSTYKQDDETYEDDFDATYDKSDKSEDAEVN